MVAAMNSFLTSWLPNLVCLLFVLIVIRQQWRPWVLRAIRRLHGRKPVSVDTMPSLQPPFVNGYWSRLDAARPGGGTSLQTMIPPHGYRPSIYDGTSETGSPWD
jgi:hypothetical protein